jgi:methionyl-tRNA formyltransferase
MSDRFEFDLVSNRTSSSSSSKSRRSYSQRNVSSLQHELTKNRKMINVKTSTTKILNRTLSFKPIPIAK